jgi:C-terminal processing protease CtpA/Prc
MKKLLLTLYSRLLLLSIFSVFIVVSCKEEDPSPGGLTAHSKVNTWIFDNMKFWYLWNDQLPANPNKGLEPEAFFTSLLSNEDRFSWIQDDYQELLNSLQGISKESGYEFVLYKENESSSNVIAQIVYIKPGSPAAQAGVKRGDVITHINGQQLTTSNYRAALEDIHENHSIKYKPILIEQQTFETEKSISLSAVQYTENPNYLHSIIEVDERKVGYFVYNFFASGTDSNPATYDSEMETIFAEFKSQGITDFILDLRFNTGGSEKAATRLASLIGNGIDNTKVFAERSYNVLVEKEILDDPELGEDFLTTRFTAEASNIGSLLSGSRVYILTSSRTASASELVINGLRPFMDVFLIGDVTYGKNVGSITLNDKEDPSNKWGLQPIVVSVANSLGQSDYGNGFQPDVLHEDNSLYIYPLGDEREALLAQALGQITGIASSGRMGRKDMKEMVGHSLDGKRRGFSLVIDQNIPHLQR